ncbi:arylesterase [Roseateles sp. BYS180W]|uniref:Arylesterase n=1 Tax=Roseateles rivi TaxID=3299028 RepID=A0ABW7FVZ1_9BURK
MQTKPTGRRQWMRDCSAWLVALSASGLWLPAAQAKERNAAKSSAPSIVVLGDSLSAEYGLPRGSGWVQLLQQRLQGRLPNARVINASISGDTTSGGRSRLPEVMRQHRPTHLVIELGGNDALRGLPMTMTTDNLRAMVREGKAAGARVLLVGMQMPPNYGARYAREFAEAFSTVAREEQVALLPFLLAGVADRPDALQWFQPDRIHPAAKAQPVMMDNVWRALQPLL